MKYFEFNLNVIQITLSLLHCHYIVTFFLSFQYNELITSLRPLYNNIYRARKVSCSMNSKNTYDKYVFRINLVDCGRNYFYVFHCHVESVIFILFVFRFSSHFYLVNIFYLIFFPFYVCF